MADRAAAVEGGPRRLLPVLAPDLLLADQLAVTGDDLVQALSAAGECAGRPDVEHLLLHRWDLLAELPPSSLGGSSVLEAGRATCQGPSAG